MIMKYLIPFLLVFALVYMLIPGLQAIAFKIGFVDRPTGRKNHNEPKPLLGGVGIFAGFLAGYLIFIKPTSSEYLSILFAAVMILGIGLVDDWYKTRSREFSVVPRLLVQIAAACLVYSSGIIFHGFTNPFTNQYLVLPVVLQFILTIMWLLGVTTVINWSDGMDGLAGSLSLIAATTLFIVSLTKGQTGSALLSVIVAGATLGFLKYNRPPARIFMGDSGANLLGFLLGVIALEGTLKQATLISILIPVLALGVPIFDNLFVVMRRLVSGRPIYAADKGQIHHRLQSMGLSQTQTVAFISLMSICLSLLSIVILLLHV